MVQRDETIPTRPFRLGLALVTLADRVLSRLDLQALARPLLVELMESTGETATLSLPGEREAITVDSVPSRSSVVSMARLGRPSIAHATAVGKVMLAFGGGPLPRERDLVALTDRTITDRGRLASEVETCASAASRPCSASATSTSTRSRRRCSTGRSAAAILGLQGPSSRLEDPTRLLGTLLDGVSTLTRASAARPAAAR